MEPPETGVGEHLCGALKLGNGDGDGDGAHSKSGRELAETAIQS